MEHFEIGDKVRLKHPGLSYGYDVGIGTVREIYADREYIDDKIWTDEDGYVVDEYIDLGTETLDVYFPKVSTVITRGSEDFELVFSPSSMSV